MRRTPGLIEVSRRDFCGLACLGAAAWLTGCTDGSTGVVQTGGLDGDGHDPNSPDAAVMVTPTDAKGSGSATPDAPANTATCTGGETDVGEPSAFTASTPVYFSNGKFFVVRDADGLYALTAKCTHEGATNNASGSQFVCPRHGARFTLNGAVVSGPVSKPLVHYSMCTLSNGHLGVDLTKTVSAATRLVA